MNRLALIAVLLSVACSSELPPTSVSDPSGKPIAPGPLAASLIVSDPGVLPAPNPARAAANSISATVVYVSLPPGTLPDPTMVRIVNLRTADAVTPALVEGGFDPIAIPAVAGDTLDVAVTAGSGVATHTQVVALRARPPRVVRTNPPKGQTDVPLNLVIVIVVSEPVDPATVNGNGIRLHLGTETVAGSLELDPSGTVLRFTPGSPLLPTTTYQLEITSTLTDRSGTPLDSPTTVSFTTAAVFAPPSAQFTSVGAGHGFSCGLTTDGAVYCWGYSWEDWIVGICPDASYYDWFPCGLPIRPPAADRLYLTPLRLTGGLTFASLSVGWRHACGITTTGAAYCWGYAAYSQLGNGSPLLRGTLVPEAVVGGIAFKSISAGDSHTCGVAVDGAAYCWGFGQYGQLANGAAPGTSCYGGCASPQKVVGDLSFQSVSAGSALTCGLTTSGAAYCWGLNIYGDLGIGRPDGPDRCEGWFQHCSRGPVAVAGEHSFTAVAARSMAACGLSSDRVTYCWGYDNLGIGPTTDDCSPWLVGECSLIPRPIGGGWQFTALSTAYERACATTANGTAYCWGWTCPTCIAGPPHPPDDAVWDFTATPTALSGGLSFAMVSAGPTSHSCGVTTTGEAYCWGDNSAGQLGDGTRTSSAAPVLVRVRHP